MEVILLIVVYYFAIVMVHVCYSMFAHQINTVWRFLVEFKLVGMTVCLRNIKYR